jgi:hypothetical protein
MTGTHRHARRILLATLVSLVISAPALGATSATASKSGDTFTRSEVLTQAESLFGKGAKGMAGAIGIGVRYGKGVLVTKGGATRSVWWQGPSVGFDLGGNAARCFTLVYNLRDTEKLFQRFPGVEGSLYFVGGFSLNYNRTDEITLAPVRLGVGWRQGANIGYLHFTPKREMLPI